MSSLDDEELDEVALESTHTIEIEAFVPRKEVDEIYLDESYYLVPDDKVGVDAFAVIRDAMEEKSLVGLARVVLYRRERLLMLEPRGKGIAATVLRYRNEVRDEDNYFDDIPNVKVAPDMLKLAEHILETKRAHFDPKKFEDRYEDALTALIKAKQAGKEPPSAPSPKPSNVINLMDALRRSVKGEKDTGSSKRGKPGSSARHTQGDGKAHGTQGQTPQTRELSCGTRSLPKEAQVRRHRRSRVAARAPAAAIATSSRSTRRRACTTICGSNSMA